MTAETLMPFIMAVRHGLVLGVLMMLAANVFAAGDAKRGAQVFRQCLACHSSVEGEHLTGPSLAHVVNHKAASAEGFQRYSDALKRSAWVWDEATLDKWLANPARVLPGTSMTFPGIKERQAREDVIAYLKALDEGKAPQPVEGSGSRMGMARPRMDLKNAPPAGQVRSITYCGDTYTVETADGKAEKVWEFNLRFKTDASKFGPEPGKPVVIGAGMQGDRASIVFASPKEVSEFIQSVCP
jgi:cytochrome c